MSRVNTFNGGDTMTRSFGEQFRRHVIAGILVAPLVACGSGGGKRTPPEPAPVAATPVRDRGAKSIEQMLTGRFAGVTVERTNAGGLRIRIRGGNNSFYNGEEPLYLIDDVPVPQGSGGIMFVNPYDIAKIEVLKNPADVAIYGMRGANGVIKITTKLRGRT